MTDITNTCFHCGADIKYNSKLTVTDTKADGYYFCCNGCKLVYQTIRDSGYCDFYQFYQRTGIPSKGIVDDVIEFDWSSAIVSKSGRNNIQFRVEQIHCSACIWLIEKSLRSSGAEEVKVNLIQKIITIYWRDSVELIESSDDRICKWIKKLSELGYEPSPLLYTNLTDNNYSYRKSLLLRTLIASFSMMQVMMLLWPNYTFDEIDINSKSLLEFASLLLTLPVISYCSLPFYRNAWIGIKNKHISMDTTVAFGLIAAFLSSIWNHITHDGPVYYDSIVMFTSFLLFTRYLELTLQKKAVNAIESLASMIPQTSIYLPHYPDTDSERVVPSFLLKKDMIVKIKSGDISPTDGIVITGNSLVTEAVFTGESIPIHKIQGDVIYAGTRNISDILLVKVTSAVRESKIAQIMEQIQSVLSYKTDIIKKSDIVARYYLTVVCIIAIITPLIWIYFNKPITYSIQVMISILIISCPCALSLASPACRAAMIARLSNKGTLTTQADALDTLTRITDVVLDKTGTLTRGEFKLISEIFYNNISPSFSAQLVLALEEQVVHPLGRSLENQIKKKYGDLPLVKLNNVKNYVSKGVEATLGDIQFRIGTWDFVSQVWSNCKKGGMISKANKDSSPAIAHQVGAENAMRSIIYLGNQDHLLAIYTLADIEKDGVIQFISELKQLGFNCHLLSGDTNASVWGKHWGINTIGRYSAEEKASFVKNLQTDSKVVLAIGDGVNDSQCFAQANVSFAISNGVPLIKNIASFSMGSSNFNDIISTIKLARRGERITTQNMLWSLLYNMTSLPLAIAGISSPLIASLGMSVSSLLVIINASRLLR